MMTRAELNAVRVVVRDGLYTALRAACREEIKGYHNLRLDTDSAAVRYGGLTTRIAYLLGRNPAWVRSHLHALAKEGKVLSHKSSSGATIRWWPVGFLDELQAEADAAKGGA